MPADKNPLQIVCGAPNARAGIKVVLARPGTVIPATGEALKIGTIRGVESRGMMCSARELLLGEDHDGIIELGADAVVGAPAAPALGLTDPVIDVSITPNRGDAASVFGIARDLAAAGLGTLDEYRKVEPVAGKFPSPKKISLDFAPEDKNACPIFAGRLIRSVKNGPAPQWVQDRLKSVGMKSISALVDATNLIAQDRGRPCMCSMPTSSPAICMPAWPRPSEQVLALDGKTYVLDDETVVIADDAAACSIAGVMGGEDTGCSLETDNVFIESAWFDPARVARAGRKLGIISDARYRFERGVDPQFVLPGLELCTRLILDWCGGEPADVVIAGELPPPHAPIPFDPGLVESLGGMRIDKDESIRILARLGFTVVEHSEILHVTPPSFRRDIDGPADLVEEIVRIHGLTGVPSVALERERAVAKPVLTAAQRRTRIVAPGPGGAGVQRMREFFLHRPRAGETVRRRRSRRGSSPTPSPRIWTRCRPSPLPSLLAAAARNAARGFSDFNLFEIGPAFQSGMPEAQTNNAAGIIAGPGVRDWTKTGHAADVFDAKSALFACLEAAMGGPMTAPVAAKAPAWFHPGRSGTVALGPKQIAWFGELHPKVLAAFDLKIPVAAFEINLDAVPEPKPRKGRAVFAPSPYQAIERDFAFVVDAEIAAGDIIKAARLADRALIEGVSVFDVYEGKNLGDGKKSIAIAVRIQPRDKTLTDTEIEALAQKLIAAVIKATGASLRR